jgi:hypothetical protein
LLALFQQGTDTSQGIFTMAEINTSESKWPDPAEPFDRALIGAANQIRENTNLDHSDDLIEGAAVVLVEIVSSTLLRAGTDHVPHPDGATIETASRAACFMAACLSGLSVNLKNQGVRLDAPAVFTRVGFAIFQWYSPQEEAAIISSGGDRFRKLLESSSEHPNVREWIEDVQRFTAAYVLTRDHKYIPLLCKEYLSLWRARGKGPDRETVK